MILEAKKLGYCIGRNWLLRHLEWSLEDKSFLAVIGPNGAGKSTLVKLIMGAIEPTEGHIRVLNQKARRSPPKEIGYVPQIKKFDPYFPAKVDEFIFSGLDSSWPFWISQKEKSLIKNALDAVNSWDLRNRNLKDLSGGELQRVYLARAFVKERKILILDEPAAGVDVMGEADLYRLLEDYRKTHQSTIVMVTHDIDVARHHATHVLLINHNQISFGSPENVLTEENLNRAFGHSQHQHKHN